MGIRNLKDTDMFLDYSMYMYDQDWERKLICID